MVKREVVERENKKILRRTFFKGLINGIDNWDLGEVDELR